MSKIAAPLFFLAAASWTVETDGPRFTAQTAQPAQSRCETWDAVGAPRHLPIHALLAVPEPFRGRQVAFTGFLGSAGVPGLVYSSRERWAIGDSALALRLTINKDFLSDTYSLRGVSQAAEASEACRHVFQERFERARSGGVSAVRDRSKLSSDIVAALPNDERGIFANVAHLVPRDAPPEPVVAELRKMFGAANLCPGMAVETQVDVFANALNLHLTQMGIETGTIFPDEQGPTSGRRTQRQILLSLVTAARLP